MAEAPAVYEEAIEGVSGLEALSHPIGYRHVDVFRGEFRGDGGSRSVTVRAVPTEKVSSNAETEFLTVAQNWRKVATHPNVVELLRWGDDPGPWVLVDDEFETTLEASGGELPLDEAEHLVTSVAEALRNAALYNNSHLTLQPAHVRLSNDMQNVQVDDWGLESTVASHVDTQYVTPYLAPEHLDQSLGVPGEQTDVYGLAGVAYFALTGSPPVAPNRDSILDETPIPPSERNVEVPDELDALLDHALDKDPTARPDGPYAFATQFQQALSTARMGAAAGQSTREGHDSRGGGSDRHDSRAGAVETTPGGLTRHTDRLPDIERRTALKLGGALAVLLSGVAASQLIGGETSGSTALSTVPDRSDFVASADAQPVLSNPDLTRVINRQLSTQLGSAADTTASPLEQVQQRLGLDIQNIRTVTAFGAETSSSTRYFAVILQTSWTADTVRAGLEQIRGSVTEESYQGTTLYAVEPDRLFWTVYVGDLGNGAFAVGTRPEVEDVLDVHADSADPIGGDVNSAFTSARQATVRFGFDIPDSVVERVDGTVPVSDILAEIEYGFGSIDLDAGNSVRLVFSTTSSSAADSLASQLSFFVNLAQTQLGQTERINVSSDVERQITTLTDSVQIETQGTDVSVTIADGTRLLPIALRLQDSLRNL